MYFGWAALEGAASKEGEGDEGDASGGGGDGGEGPWKCVANVGYSPTFAGQENAEKIVEGHLIGYEGARVVTSLFSIFLPLFCFRRQACAFVVRFLPISSRFRGVLDCFSQESLVDVFFFCRRGFLRQDHEDVAGGLPAERKEVRVVPGTGHHHQQGESTRASCGEKITDDQRIVCRGGEGDIHRKQAEGKNREQDGGMDLKNR